MEKCFIFFGVIIVVLIKVGVGGVGGDFINSVDVIIWVVIVPFSTNIVLGIV